MKKTKVLHVIGYLGIGGDSNAVFNVLNYIEKENLNIEFQFLTHLGGKHNDSILKTVSMLEKKEVKVNMLDGDVRKLGPIKYYKYIKRILKENKYDAIHIHTSFQGVIAVIAAKHCNINKRILHSHTTKIQRKISKLLSNIGVPICRFLIRIYATDFIACGEEAGKYLFGKKCNQKVIYNGIDLNKFSSENKELSNLLREKYNFKKENIIVGHVGRFSNMKNQKFILELAQKTNIDENIKYMLIGDGDDLEKLTRIAEENKLNNIFFVGRVDNVNEYMQIFDYFILPSLYGEGLPVVLIEAQVAGCKCIATNNITKESDIGMIKFLSLDNQSEWILEFTNQKPYNNSLDASKFDIDITAKEWVNLYYD